MSCHDTLKLHAHYVRLYRTFSHDVMAVIYETAATLVLTLLI